MPRMCRNLSPLLLIVGILLGKVKSACELPSQPGIISLISNGTNSISLSWGDPINMTDVTKSFNITYSSALGNGTVSSNNTNVTLHNLSSGTKYTITVVTVTDCQYQSSPVNSEVTTRPYPVNNLTISSKTDSITLNWSKPYEYNNNYTYKVQTDVSSTIVQSESATINNLTPGKTYTFTVTARAYNETEGDSVSVTGCTYPTPPGSIYFISNGTNNISVSWGDPINMTNVTKSFIITYSSALGNGTVSSNNTNVTLQNLSSGTKYTITVVTIADCQYQSSPVNSEVTTRPNTVNNLTISSKTDSITLNWSKPYEYNSNYTYKVQTDVSSTIVQSESATISNLTPGKTYTFTVTARAYNETEGDSVSVTGCTYPTPPDSIYFISNGTNIILLSWGDPINMTNVTNSFNITYSSTLGNGTVSSNNTNVTLQNLSSGTKYRITIVTVAACQYQSSSVISKVTTRPYPVNNLTISSKTDSITLNWSKPYEYNNNYTYKVQTDVSSTIVQSESATISNLTPGKAYTFTITARAYNETEGDSVSVTGCTYPTPPGSIYFISNGTNIISLSWGDPINMTNVTKSFNITYSSALGNGTVSSNNTNVTLQNLSSGTKYTITVVTVADCQYQSSSVNSEVTTRPYPVNNLTISSKTDSTTLNWSKPYEYNSNYTYKVQTDVSSTIVQSESATISNLTPGKTYTFTVTARAYNETEGDSVSVTGCTYPTPPGSIYFISNGTNSISLSWGAPINMTNVTKSFNITYSSTLGNGTVSSNNTNVTLQNLSSGTKYTITVVTVTDCQYQSSPVNSEVTTRPYAVNNLTISSKTDSITLNWSKPYEYNNNYTYKVQTDVSSTIVQSESATISNLTPGKTYTFTVTARAYNETEGDSVSVTGCTYPTPPGSIYLISNGTNSISLSWGDPINMTNVTKSFNITYSSTLGNGTVSSNNTNVTLQNLSSGTKYTITVVTVADCQYQSSSVNSEVTTRPYAVNNLTISSKTDSITLNWSKPYEYNNNYTYKVQTDVSSTIVQSESATISNLTPGKTYTFTVTARAYNETEGDSVSVTGCTFIVQCVTDPTPPGSIYFISNGTNSISLSWGAPINMTNVTKSFNITYSNALGNGTVSSNNTNVTLQNLSSGTKYTITVVTFADCQYQSSPVNSEVTTRPYAVNNVTISSKTDSITLNWSKPYEYNNNYTYKVQTDVSSTIVQSESATISNLTPGKTYTFTVTARAYNETEGDSVSVTGCTYPTPPGSIYFISNGTNSISLSWGAPINMTNVTKSFNITYSSTLGNGTASSNNTNVTLQNLSSGTKYTITVVTIADCQYQSSLVNSEVTTRPYAVNNLTISSKTDSITLNWSKPYEYNNNYTYKVQTDMSSTIVQSESATISNLTPGKTYTFTVTARAYNETEGDSVSVTGCTYPTPPGSIYFISNGTNSISLSWGAPINMTNVTKSFNITYSSTLGNGTASSNNTNVTLQNLSSGTKYTITVVTVADCQYQSSPVNSEVTTRPYAVNNLTISSKTDSITLNWSKPYEYNNNYTYKVQTDVSSTIVQSESATISNLTPGKTYTFTVTARAYNETEGDSVSVTGCTYPTPPGSIYFISNGTNSISLSWGDPINMTNVTKSFNITYSNALGNGTVSSNNTNVTLQNLSSGTKYTITVVTFADCQYQSSNVNSEVTTRPYAVNNVTISSKTDSITLNWSKPYEYNNNYTYKVQTDVSSTIVQSESATISNLTPGKTYTFTVTARAYNESEGDSVSVTGCTYPTPPGSIYFISNGTNSISLSWGDPINMTNVTKSFNITYSNALGNGTVSSNNTNVTLQNLSSGTKYTITVVTFADCQYQSSPVNSEVTTRPYAVNNVTISSKTDSITLNWSKPYEYNNNYTYKVQTDVSSTIVQSESATISNLTPGKTYTFTVTARAYNETEGDSVSVTGCTYPTPPGSIYFISNGTNSISLSWGAPINMTNVTKSFNITYSSTLGNGTASSNNTNVTLQNLSSGTKYTITVVTVADCQYQSSPVNSEVTTRPYAVNNLTISSKTDSITLNWSKPYEYNNNYTYKVQTDVSSTIVQSESATISNLTPGKTYTFTVTARAYNETEGDSVSVTGCTYPTPPGSIYFISNGTNSISLSWGDPINMTNVTKSFNITYSNALGNGTVSSNNTNVTLQNLSSGTKYTITVVTFADCQYRSSPVNSEVTTRPYAVNNVTISSKTDSITLNWSKPYEYNNNYTYKVQTDVSSTIVQSESATISNLTPGKTYTFTVTARAYNETEGDSVSVTGCTYPTPPGSIYLISNGKNSISISWGDPINMTNVTKSFNITYSNALGNGTVSSNNTNVTLQNLSSGIKYTITVVTVADCQYKSSSVNSQVTTRPYAVNNLTISSKTDSITLNWSKPYEYNSNYTYKVQTDVSSTIVQSESATISNLTPGKTYTFTVTTRAYNETEGDSVSVTGCTYPTPPGSIYFISNGTNSISLSWGDPINMTHMTKSFNITYSNALGNGTVSSNNTNVTLQNLSSGTKYTITVVTVAACQYKSSSVNSQVTTRPYAVNNVTISSKTDSITLNWSKPYEYNNNYTYKVQTDVSSTIVQSESATISNLTPGKTYTFTVTARAYNETEGDSVSVTGCTYPTPPGSIYFISKGTNIILLSWGNPINMTNVTKSFNITYSNALGNGTVSSNNTNVILQNLSSGTKYTITVITVADCQYQSSAVISKVTTRPSAVNNLIISSKTDSITLNWSKTYEYNNNYTYKVQTDVSSTIVQSESATISNLTPGKTYTFTVTARAYNETEGDSVSVTGCTYPTPPGSIYFISNGTNSISLSWGDPINMTNVTKSFNITYSSALGNGTVSSSNTNITLQNLSSGTKYTIMVVTIAACQYQSSSVISEVTTIPEAVPSFNCRNELAQPILIFEWQCPNGLFDQFELIVGTETTSINAIVQSNCISGNLNLNLTNLKYYTDYTVNITTISNQKRSFTVIKSCKTAITSPPVPTVTPVLSMNAPSFDQIDISFAEFDSRNGPLQAYAVIVTTDKNAERPQADQLTYTYDDFKSKTTQTYVTYIKVPNSQTKWSNRDNLLTVQIGNGNKTHGYYNGPLEPVTSYRIGIAGFTSIKYDESDHINMTSSLVSIPVYSWEIPTPQKTEVIIGAVVGSIIGALVIGLMGFFIWWKTRKIKKSTDIPIEKMKKADSGNFAFYLGVSLWVLYFRKNPMRTERFEAHFRRQHADSNLGFSAEYSIFTNVGVTQSKNAAEMPDNKTKNRFTNVLPYDVSRVKLSIMSNPTDDYINANYIPGYTSKTEFIAAQGPLPQTVNDFWRMIWEKNIRTIVMLTRCIETGKLKCEEYWPSNNSKICGDLIVHLRSEEVFPNWTIREFTVTNNRNSAFLSVRHFHFTAWPDHGVPDATVVLMNFRNIICDYVKHHCSPNSPTLVHCSAGVGRTGTFIALDRIMRQIEAEDSIDVFGTVYNLRMNRSLMVQTESQYVFLNQCALDFIKARKDQRPDLIYQNSGADGIYENMSCKA
ncbi:receptor-type tyrosine-protein phosphatase beta [Bombina bombina]|uniref:receptor-type tyrosine-protein phosphatase beta n=1 Tax=Bombina bombina TaxID=8345 RepID=UPI00235A789C|nr:receptor-type tyrosine-protein phosphatase beta [Bombina bombina]